MSITTIAIILTLKSSAFNVQSAMVCFTRVSEPRAFTSPYNFDRLVSVMKKQCVFHQVRSKYLSTAYIDKVQP